MADSESSPVCRKRLSSLESIRPVILERRSPTMGATYLVSFRTAQHSVRRINDQKPHNSASRPLCLGVRPPRGWDPLDSAPAAGNLGAVHPLAAHASPRPERALRRSACISGVSAPCDRSHVSPLGVRVQSGAIHLAGSGKALALEKRRKQASDEVYEVCFTD